MKRLFCFYYEWLIGIAVIVFFADPGRAAENEMTVEDAIAIGLKNNYSIRIARTTAEIAANNRGKGTANFLPKLDAGETFRYDAKNEDTGSPLSFGNADTRQWTSEVRLNWTLFDGFRMFADKRRYDELARASYFEAKDKIEATVVGIMRSFFNLVQQEQLLDVAQETRDISRVRLEREQARHELGGASSADLLNARVNFNKDQSALLDQELQVTIAAKELNILLARDPLTPCTVRKEITIPALDLPYEQLLALAKANNSTLLSAQHNLNAARENVRMAQSAFWPRLDLSGSYGYNDRSLFGDDVGPLADRSGHSINAGAGLIMSFNIFNGNIDRINLQNARLEAHTREFALRDTENRIAGFLREKYATFQKRMEKLNLEEQNLETARINLERQKERYATGAADSLDFRDAQVNYSQAQVRLIVARYDARIALLEVEQLIGRISVE